jgi:hypothetical protein
MSKSFLATLPPKPTQIFALTLAAVAAVLWIGGAGAGVQSMANFTNSALGSGVSNADDLEAIAMAHWNGQVASLVASLVLSAGFGGLVYWLFKMDAKNSTRHVTTACLIGAAFAIVMGVATTSALIDGTTDLGILAASTATQVSSTVPHQKGFMVDATNDARTAPAAFLSLSLASVVALLVGVAVLYKKGKGK